MQRLVNHLRGRGAPGSIVNILSVHAHGGAPELAVYASTKAALAGLDQECGARPSLRPHPGQRHQCRLGRHPSRAAYAGGDARQGRTMARRRRGGDAVPAPADGGRRRAAGALPAVGSLRADDAAPSSTRRSSSSARWIEGGAAMRRLSRRLLPELDRSARRPTYDRDSLRDRHRAYRRRRLSSLSPGRISSTTCSKLDSGAGAYWASTSRPPRLADLLAPQDCLYSRTLKQDARAETPDHRRAAPSDRRRGRGERGGRRRRACRAGDFAS